MITIHTGAGGMELFQEMMDRELGYERVYLRKVPRILKSKFKKSPYTGKYYKRIKMPL